MEHLKMKRYHVIGASILLGAIFGALGTMSVVHTASIDVVQQTLPTPGKCESVNAQELRSAYADDSALIQALEFVPDDLSFLRCHSSQ